MSTTVDGLQALAEVSIWSRTARYLRVLEAFEARRGNISYWSPDRHLWTVLPRGSLSTVQNEGSCAVFYY